jgi:hypothetical protein
MRSSNKKVILRYNLFHLKYLEFFFLSNFPDRIVLLLAAARVEHAHGGAGDDVRDLQQEGEEQVVPAPTSRHASRRSAQKIIKNPCPSPFKGTWRRDFFVSDFFVMGWLLPRVTYSVFECLSHFYSGWLMYPFRV